MSALFQATCTDVESEESENESDSSSHYSSSYDSEVENDGLKSLPSEPSSECLFPRTISRHLKWHPRTDLILSPDHFVVQSQSYTKGEAHISEPLRRTGEFEVKVEAKGPSTRDGFFGIGIRRRQHRSPRPLHTLSGCCIWQTSAIYNALKNTSSTVSYQTARDLELLIKGDRVGMRITKEGDLEFFINGMSQGIAARDVYKPNKVSKLYPLIKLPAGYTVQITSGGKSTMQLYWHSVQCIFLQL